MVLGAVQIKQNPDDFDHLIFSFHVGIDKDIHWFVVHNITWSSEQLHSIAIPRIVKQEGFYFTHTETCKYALVPPSLPSL